MILDHVTVIVQDSDAAAAALGALIGVTPKAAIEAPGMRIVSLDCGAWELHANAPTGPGPIQRILLDRGPGVHHVAFSVGDIGQTLSRLAEKGIRSLGQITDLGNGVQEVFLDPSTTGDVLVQLVQRQTAGRDQREMSAQGIEELTQIVGAKCVGRESA